MENAVLKASGGSALHFPLNDRQSLHRRSARLRRRRDDRRRLLRRQRREDFQRRDARRRAAASRWAAIVHVKSRLRAGASVPMQHIAFGDPATIYPPEKAPEIHAKMQLLRRRLQPRGRATTCARAPPRPMRSFCARPTPRTRRSRSTATSSRRRGARARSRRQTQATQVDKVVDVMMLELEEMEHRRQQAIKRQKGR